MRQPLSLFRFTTFLPLLSPLATASPNCLFHGPAFPKPTGLPTHPLVEAAAANLTAAFSDLVSNETTIVTANNSWSLQAFSVHSDEPFWANYHTALNLDAVNSTGTREVGGDSVYRLGSLTKIFTVLTWLVDAGDELWHAPITRFIPELAAAAERQAAEGRNPVRFVNWEVVTVGALAGQMSGIPRDCEFLPPPGRRNAISSSVQLC